MTFDKSLGIVKYYLNQRGVFVKLRPYQQDLTTKIYEHWNNGLKNVLLQLPTGGGKTKTFSNIAISMALEYNKPTAIAVHRKELVQQISLTLAEENIIHNIIAPRDVIAGIVSAQRQLLGKQFYDYNAKITVISVDTLNARFEKHHQAWAKTIKFWIVDEAAHLLKDNKWGRAVKYFTNAIGLGVTATPERLDKRGLGSHVDGVFDVMVQGPSTKWLIENKYLCNYKVAIPVTDYEQHLSDAKADKDYSKDAMINASEKSQIVGDVVINYQKFAAGKQAIVFASDIGTAFKMEKKFLDAGIKAKTLTGDTPDKERFDTLVAYRKKEIQVLINVDLFDEGLDVPGIEAVFLCRPTASLSKYLQMVGRGLRVDGDKILMLVDMVGNVKRHGLPDSRRTWSLDRVRRRKKKINLIRFCQNFATCGSPFDRMLHICPYCGWEDKPGKKGPGGGRPGPAEVDGDLVLLDPETLRALEQNTQLENPLVTKARITASIGTYAGIAAEKHQRERIETQKELCEVIADWAGKLRAEGYTDRMINKEFYGRFDTTIWEILALPRADMLEVKKELENE